MTGFLDLTAADYHADELGDRPTLSRSIIHTLVTASPKHAWTQHPKLNPEYQRIEEDKFDVGTACHDLFLGGPDRVAVFDFKDWRTNEAKEAKFQARVQGKIPMLAKDHGRVLEMADALTRQLADFPADPPLFADGKAEQTLVWEEDGVVCRARPDWMRDDLAVLDDLKCTTRLAQARSWSKTIYGLGYDIQAAFYTRGVEALTGKRPEFRLVVIETQPPYEISVIGIGADIMTIGRKKIDWALPIWRECLETGEWPGYPRQVFYPELPAWEEAAWLEQEVAA